MASDLPDIDESLSFVVDDGEAVGPLALSEIARSISAGDRAQNCLVWWVGAREWVTFNSNVQLVMLLEQPPLPEASKLEDRPAEVEEIAVSTEPLVIDLTEEVEPDIEIEPDIGADTKLEAGPLEEIVPASSSVLANVSARLDALASSTRHYQASTKLDAAGASPASAASTVFVEAQHAASPSPVRGSVFETEFDVMVRQTENYRRLADQSERVRELLARACGAAVCRNGYTVGNRDDRDGDYVLNFENATDTRGVRLDIAAAQSVTGVESQHVEVSMTWGRMAFDIDEALVVVQGQPRPAKGRPGQISCIADLESGSVSTRVDLVWQIERYVGRDFSIDRSSLEGAVDAAMFALEQRWYELFIPAE